jgi:Zn-dependent peptidase ImmA (M78 family)/transcriptional regulator with XRE-family HTH domain
MINGDRVRQARELRGLTQTALAQAVGVRQSTIAHVETGRSQPSGEVLEKIAVRTGFPPAFFRLGPPPQFPEGSLLFRALRSTSARDRAQAQRYGELIFERAQELSHQSGDNRGLRLPQLSGATTPPMAASLTRSSFGLRPDAPVPNLVGLIEKAGVLVIMLPVRLPKRDAYSLWAGMNVDQPVIVLSAEVPGDRLRLSAAHELGHIVMHRTLTGTVRQLEQEANAYAAELLMPAEALLKEFRYPLTLSALAELKGRWRVSMQALLVRARSLGAVEEHHYQYLFQQIGMRGWRTREPIDIPLEHPTALTRLKDSVYGPGVDERQLASRWALPIQLVRAMFFPSSIGIGAAKVVSLTSADS